MNASEVKVEDCSGVAAPSSVASRSWTVVPTLALMALVVWIFRTSQYSREYEIDLALVQYAVLPILFVLAWWSGWIGAFIPRSVAVTAAAVLIVVGIISFSNPSEGFESFIVARLRDDPLESNTRIFRQEIGHKLQLGLTARIDRNHKSFQYDQEARVELDEDPSRNGIIWGDRKYLAVSLPRTPEQSLDELGLKFLPDRLRGLRMITSVPIVGISFEPTHDTSFYLAHLFDGLLPRRTPKDWLSGLTDRIGELSLRTAAVYRAHWTAINHQALPWWELGNRYFYAALVGGEFHQGEMSCALYAYRRARQALPKGGNAELSAAISNNAAIAVAIQQYYTASKVNLKYTKRAFNRAMHQRRDPKPWVQRYESWRVAYYNLHWLNLFTEPRNPHRKGNGHKKLKGRAHAHR